MKRVLFIGGSLNQTTIVHAVSKQLDQEYDCYFTPFYADGILQFMNKSGLLDFTIMGGIFRQQTESYLLEKNLKIDYAGRNNHYDLVVMAIDLIVPKNIRGKKVVLIQEGMTDPENLMYQLVKTFKLPRYLASTASVGLSDAYDKFCVASQEYRDLFIRKGVNPQKLVVTGIPNFDNAAQYLKNDFPHKNYILVATSDTRETFKFDNRKKFVRKALEIANGKSIIFKLHPNERVDRATREIHEIIPHAMVYADGNINHMIANCDVLITQYSSVVYIGLSLGKEVYSYFDIEMLKRLTPLQNGGTSSKNIAQVCRDLLENEIEEENVKRKFYFGNGRNASKEVELPEDSDCNSGKNSFFQAS